MLAVRHILSYSRQLNVRKCHHLKKHDQEVNVPDINAHNMGGNGDYKHTFAQKSEHARWIIIQC
jgi:hypothetical protein